MAASTITLPCLGIINVPVGLAPFQFPYSKPNLGLPYFMNGTSGFSVASGTNGFLGLKYCYGNIPISVGATTAQGFVSDTAMGMVQFAGGVVQSFGVFDYTMLLPNPFAYLPSMTAFYNQGSYSWVQTPGFATYQPGMRALTASQVSQTFSFPFPDLMFSNLDQPLSYGNAYQIWAHNGTVALGSVGGLAYIDPLSHAWFTTKGSVIDAGSSPTCNKQVYVQSSSAPANLVPAASLDGHGIYAGNNFNDSTAGCHVAIATPAYGGRWLMAFQTSGGQPPLCTQPMFTGETSPAGDPTLHSRQAVNFAVASDQALIPGGTFAASIKGTVDPAGNFLITPFPANSVDGGNIWFYILGDMSGYYRVILTGTTPTIQTAINHCNNGGVSSSGFGIDINGNFWLIQSGQQQPLLYSSLGLGAALNYSPFPNVSAGSVACRTNLCNFPWFG